MRKVKNELFSMRLRILEVEEKREKMSKVDRKKKKKLIKEEKILQNQTN